MAHECPDCGLQCYCGGDIDDCLVGDENAENNCTHYLRPECSPNEEEWFEDEA